MTKGELLQSNLWLVIFSVVYMCLSVVFIRAAPSIGLILANSISILSHKSFVLSFGLILWSKLLLLFASIGSFCDKNGAEQKAGIDISNCAIQLIRSSSQSGLIFLNTSRYGDAYHLFSYIHTEIL